MKKIIIVLLAAAASFTAANKASAQEKGLWIGGKLGLFSEETDADFDLMVIEEEAIEALYSAIDRLPAQSARIMRLVVKGDKNQEIADQLGISVNSVKTLKYNALNILRKELTGSLLLLLAWFEVQG